MINTINRFIFILVGLIIVMYTIYIRFIVIRLPKDLFLYAHGILKYKLILFLLFSLLLCIYIIIKNIIILLNKHHISSLGSQLIFIINTIIDNALFEVTNVIMQFIPNAYDKFSYISQKFYGFFSNYTEATFLLVLYFIRIIILITFLIDVFMFFKLQYMYKSLFLLCISLGINIFFYILHSISNNKEELEDSLIIIYEGFDKETNLPITSYKFKPEFDGIDLDYSSAQYILCNKLAGYLENYDKYSCYFGPRINIIIYSLYLFGWLYVLYVNINFYFFIV